MTTLIACLITTPLGWVIGVKLADWLYDLTHRP
jgi:hypothetical protein